MRIKRLENERYETLGAGHVGAIGLAQCAQQSSLFRADAAIIDVAGYKKEDRQAEPTPKGEADPYVHDKCRRVARMPYPAVRPRVDHWLSGADDDSPGKVLAQDSKTVAPEKAASREQQGAGVQGNARDGNDKP